LTGLPLSCRAGDPGPPAGTAGASGPGSLLEFSQITSLVARFAGNPLTEQPADTTGATTGLTELAALLLSAESVEEALHHLARMAVVVVPDGPSCGITVAKDGQYTTVVYSGSIPALVDEAQYQRGDGPCLEALRTGAPVIVQDLSREDQARWGGFPPVALAAGTHGVLAYPLEVDNQIVGVLNLYAHERNLFPEPVQLIAKQFVDPAALLLSGVLRRLSQDELIAHLNAALGSRAVIDQAIGIIMASRACSADEAFAVLRRMSNDRNVKLRDVAAAMTEAAAAGKRSAAGG
jgi:transcriptional regulator with GAF, ATPase, and Fis domain